MKQKEVVKDYLEFKEKISFPESNDDGKRSLAYPGMLPSMHVAFHIFTFHSYFPFNNDNRKILFVVM